MTISVDHLTKRFGGFTALDDISLTIPDGKLTALLGPSGSGKTTLLRCIAGLERANGGTITIDGVVSEAASPAERGVGFVFQHYALFRHMTVAENVAFGLEVRPKETRPSKEVISAKVRKLLELVQLDWAAGRLPHQLSGGQRQRIALARALAVEPKYLLLDEPFGALDAQVRKELRRWLRRLHDEVPFHTRGPITTILVTHDQEEALEVADQVVVFNGGKVEQVGTPEEVYHAPASPFVHQFLGTVNLLSGEGLHTYIRPHDLKISTISSDSHPLLASITAINAAGPVVRIDLRHGDTPLEAVVSHADHERQPVTVGQEVHVGFHRTAVYKNPRLP